jgi:LPS-assembly protein
MMLRIFPARLALLLLVTAALAAADAQARQPEKRVAAAPVAEEPATAPPMPQLSPSLPYRPLNFYTRTELLGLPESLRPVVRPGCSGAYVAPPLPKLGGDELGLQSPVYIAADRMQLDEGGESQVSGNVEVRQGQNLMRADSAVITGGRERILLSGHVFLQDPAMTLEAGQAELTLDGSGSHIVGAQYALHDAHIRGSARAIRRENLYSISIEGGAYSTCEPGHDTWSLISEEIRLDQEAGWGSARNVRLEVQSVPLLYIPWITFPIDKRRRSGVLYPTVAFSDGNGADIGVPYYFNLDPQYDLMLTPRWIEKRGLLAEAELRYLHGSPQASSGSGLLGVGVIAKDAAYGDEERHVFRFRHNGNPTQQWNLFADTTTVSDDDYLNDLNTQLSVNRDSHLVRVVQTRYDTSVWQSLARVQTWQTIDPTILAVNQPYQRQPQLQASGSMPAGNGLRFSADAELVFFDRDVLTAPAANPTGTRVRAEPGARWLLQGNAWELEPAAQVRYTGYALSDNPGGDTLDYAIPTATLGGKLFLERPLRLRKQDWTQTLEPRAFLLYTPYENQNDAPLFDTAPLTFGYDQLFRSNRFIGGDRVADAQQVSLALESRLLAADGSEAGRIGVGQALYAADRRVQLTPAIAAETGSRSPVVANVGWRIAEQWRARAEGQWAATDGDFVRGNWLLNWQDERFRTFNAAYRFEKYSIDQTELSGLYPVNDGWTLVGRWLFDFSGARSLEALGGFEYESCCWRARVLARRTMDISSTSTTLVPEQGIVFEIELKGLGSLGDQVSNELAETIPGYDNRRQSLR